MEYQASIIDLIRKRKSCRTFIKKEIEPGEVQKLNAFISDINSAIDIKARFMLVKRNITENNKPEKLGTYGFISGADSFIIGIISKEEKKVEFFGYNFEKIVLFATDLGLGTCWLGGFFKRSDFEKKPITIFQHKLRVLMKCYTIRELVLDEINFTIKFKKTHKINGLKMEDSKEYSGKYEVIGAENPSKIILKLII